MKNIFLLMALAGICGCREKYELLLSPDQTSYLVVEGFINTSGITNIILSRTTPLQNRGVQFENGASMRIEGENNTSFILTGADSGRYVSEHLTLDENIRYRLNFKTENSKEYYSDFTSPVRTPEIDSISYTRYNGGVEIFANARSEQNVQYYRYEYDEDWEFKSFYKQALAYDFDYSSPTKETIVTPFDTNSIQRYDDSLFTCWQQRKSSALILRSTAGLNENKVYASLVFYPRASWELSYLYCISVRQFGLSKGCYNFYQKMKKNTESLGSIFDAQPSEIEGNIHCVTDVSEKIIGHIDATRSTEIRAFIKNSDLEEWNYSQGCALDTLFPYTPSFVWSRLSSGGLALTLGEYEPSSSPKPKLIGIRIAAAECVDCRLRGKHERPAFWPN